MRSSVAYAALAFGLAGLVWLAPARARACSCMAPPPPRDAAAAADAVFQGKVTALKVDQPEGSFMAFHVYTLEVQRRWKGDAAQTLTIRTADNSAACGRPFDVGETYLVYAKQIDGALSDNLCSRTRKASEADEDFAALGSADGEPEPAPAPSGPETRANEPEADAPPAPSPNARGCAVTTEPPLHAAGGFVLLTLWLGPRRRSRPG